VVLRFPQPELPDLNMMNVDMMFAANPARPGRGYSIVEFDPLAGAIDMASCAGEMNTNFVDENLAMNTIGDFRGEMVVRQGSTINMNGPAITNNDFTILDDSGAPVVLNVAGAANINGDVSVSERL